MNPDNIPEPCLIVIEYRLVCILNSNVPPVYRTVFVKSEDALNRLVYSMFESEPGMIRVEILSRNNIYTGEALQ